MKHAGDEDRGEHWSDTSYRWGSPSATTVAAVEPTSPVPGSQERRPRRDRQPAIALCIEAEHGALDERCRATLRKLRAAGCTQAHTPYSIEQFQVGEEELRYLERHGFVNAEASALLQPVITSVEKQKAGADVGKLTVVMNVTLR